MLITAHLEFSHSYQEGRGDEFRYVKTHKKEISEEGEQRIEKGSPEKLLTRELN